MRFNNAVPGVILILFAIAEIVYTTTFPRLFGQDYGPNLFPILIGIGLLVCGAILVVQGIAERGTVPVADIGGWAQDRGNLLNVALLLGSILLYILVSDAVGFIPLSLLILTTLLVRFGSSLGASLVIATATTFVIHTLFAKVLLVPLPWGIMLPIAW